MVDIEELTNSFFDCAFLENIELKNIELIQGYLSQGVSIDAKDKATGYTALDYAVIYKKEQVALLLIRLGADLNVCQENILTLAEKKGLLQVVALIEGEILSDMVEDDEGFSLSL